MEIRRRKSEAGADREAVEKLVLALSELCEELEPRTSIRQALAFALIVRAHITGAGITVSDLQKNEGEAGVRGAFFGQSVARTHIALQEKKWIGFEEAPGDRRKRFLVLLPEGKRMAARVIRHLKGR